MGHCHDPSSRLLPSPPPQTQPLVWGREAKYCTPIILAAPFTNFRHNKDLQKSSLAPTPCSTKKQQPQFGAY